MLLEGAKSTSGHDRFASRAAHCEAALSELEERIKILSTVQRKWIYLDPVYGSEAAPNDSGRWSRGDKEFRFVIIRLMLIWFNNSIVTSVLECHLCFRQFLDILWEKYPGIPEYRL